MNIEKNLDGKFYEDYLEQLSKRGVVFSYNGFLNEDILFGIGNALRTKMLIDEVDFKKSRAIFSAFVEQVQNVIRYSAHTVSSQALSESDEIEHIGLSHGHISINELEDGSRGITCCNLIKNEDVARISAALDSLKGLSRKELSSLMRQQLNQDAPEGSVGAGAGFTSIAWEASGNWVYEMLPGPTNHTLFCFKTYF
jgi:hypothetical protein